jgi:hypothetical protein
MDRMPFANSRDISLGPGATAVSTRARQFPPLIYEVVWDSVQVTGTGIMIFVTTVTPAE